MQKKRISQQKKDSGSDLKRLSKNIDTLIENDKLILGQFDKLQDEVAIVRNDIYDIKADVTNVKIRLYDIERDIKTIKRITEEEQGKRKDLEARIRKVVPKLPAPQTHS
jgi:chromosome segregation ATPase